MKHGTPSKENQEIGYQILDYYVRKNSFNYAAANKEMSSLAITDIRTDGDTVEIYTGRPGLLIGRKGANIDSLTNFLGKKVKIVESFHWNEILCAYDPAEVF